MWSSPFWPGAGILVVSRPSLPTVPYPQTSANVKNSKEKAVNAYNEFQEELVKLSKAADAYNEAALAEHAQFPYNFGIWSQNPKYLESSVSV
eukprot:scaffold95791_cov28-Tisochrysis_lutea.AAC.1